MKVSIITPTYNDAESISETFSSLSSQTFTDWEWIIVNDGSTDNTDDVVTSIISQCNKDQIIYKKQPNADQLNAIINGLQYVTGDYVFILHSDDLLPCDSFLSDCISFMQNNKDCDGIFGDLLLIDENNNPAGVQTVQQYTVRDKIPPLQLLWLGRNLFCDVAFHKTEIFKTHVYNNYLLWNRPFWLSFDENGTHMLNYKKAEFPLLKYRIHTGNYINNEIGKLNVINGELRTAIKLMEHYNIPFYSMQYFLYRVFNRLKLKFTPYSQSKPTVNKADVIDFIIKKRYSSADENLYLKAIYGFYKSQSQRVLELDQLPEDLPIYYGKDMRAFNKKLIENRLEEKEGFYQVPEYTETEDSIIANYHYEEITDEETLE